MMFAPIKIAIPALLLVASAAFAAEPAAEPASEPAPAAAPEQNTSSTDASPAVDTSAPAASGRRAQHDRLDLDTTIVTGNRELPKVLYIVPWKKADLGELPAQPFNTLLDEVLTPVDRDVFRREMTYYGVVSSGGNGSSAAPAPPGSEGGAPAGADEK